MKVMEVKATEWLERARPLFEASYQEVMLHVGIPKPEINMPVFRQLDELGFALALVALTTEDEIVGYTLSYMVPLFLYGGMNVMNNESLFVAQEHRGRASLQLIRETERAAKARGAARMQWHALPGTKADGLFARLGYKNFDSAWSKEI